MNSSETTRISIQDESSMDRFREAKSETYNRIKHCSARKGVASAEVVQKNRKENMEFPNTIEGFGYRFNDRGQLRNIQTGKPFEFAVTNDHQINQMRYEALGSVVDEYVYGLLIKEGLERVEVPVDGKPSGEGHTTFIFQSRDALTNPNKLLLVIHGSGMVRAGQWARRLIINDSIEKGTQLGYIRRAMALGYGVIVLNPNDNKRNGVPVRGSETPEKHVLHIWDCVVTRAAAKHIAVVAHSYGGVLTMHLLTERPDSLNRTIAVALTDSVHFPLPPSLLEDVRHFAKNWQRNSKPLDTPLQHSPQDVAAVSAGTEEHSLTSWMAFASVFDFLEEMYMKTIAIEST
ncbi:protein FAM172A-like [Varroa destructor]|uniref:Arb2 domain-containing protein n=1 Tax=Varroa destructor TaxID=109461 RepID=A0A7M7JKX3_VARDE|nr:protein FAM172A-like [Varroa destructor]